MIGRIYEAAVADAPIAVYDSKVRGSSALNLGPSAARLRAKINLRTSVRSVRTKPHPSLGAHFLSRGPDDIEQARRRNYAAGLPRAIGQRGRTPAPYFRWYRQEPPSSNLSEACDRESNDAGDVGFAPFIDRRIDLLFKEFHKLIDHLPHFVWDFSICGPDNSKKLSHYPFQTLALLGTQPVSGILRHNRRFSPLIVRA